MIEAKGKQKLLIDLLGEMTSHEGTLIQLGASILESSHRNRDYLVVPMIHMRDVENKLQVLRRRKEELVDELNLIG